MIRRDYLMRAIEECVRALKKILQLTEAGEVVQARKELDLAMRALAGLDLQRVCFLSDSELIAALLQGEAQAFREKGLLVVALLARAGELNAKESRPIESRICFLRALQLQLQILAQDNSTELPDYVPKVDALVEVLEEDSAGLPPASGLALMQYYERTGKFGKAEDVFFAMMQNEEVKTPWLEFGRQFYERLLRQSDLALEVGNLPRPEVEAGLAELKTLGQG